MGQRPSPTDGALALRRFFAEHPKLSQYWLADALGVKQSAVSRWVVGKQRPRAHLRVALDALLGIPVADWLTAAERGRLRRVIAAADAVGARRVAS